MTLYDIVIVFMYKNRKYFKGIIEFVNVLVECLLPSLCLVKVKISQLSIF